MAEIPCFEAAEKAVLINEKRNPGFWEKKLTDNDTVWPIRFTIPTPDSWVEVYKRDVLKAIPSLKHLVAIEGGQDA